MSGANSRLAKKLQEEFALYAEDESLKFTIDTVDDDVTNLRVSLSGPEESPYADGLFFLSLTVPATYPSTAPSIKFETKIYHPNIQDDGTICLEQLKSDWKATFTLDKAISFVYCLMEHPNWDMPLVSAIGQEHKENPALFEKKAKEFTAKYAV
jgi:ubiquitin-conjugating enzyme E2 D/E